VLDREQHDIGALRPTIRNRPLGFDHAPDAAKMFDEFRPLGVRRMNDVNPQPPQITKNLDSHFQFSVTGCS
jgi:hypothetical protein